MQYNDANYIVRHENGYSSLYTKKDGAWVAQVPTQACIVECVQPCRTYIAPDSKPWDVVTSMSREMRTMKQTIAKLAKALKER